MDKIQIYYLVLISLSLIVGFFKHGHIDKTLYDFRYTFIAALLNIPIIGRIFNIW